MKITINQMYNHAIQNKSRMLYVIWLVDSNDECWDNELTFPLREKRAGRKFGFNSYLKRNFSCAHHRTQAGRYAHKLYCCGLNKNTVQLKKAFRRLMSMAKSECPKIVENITHDYVFDVMNYPEE